MRRIYRKHYGQNPQPQEYYITISICTSRHRCETQLVPGRKGFDAIEDWELRFPNRTPLTARKSAAAKAKMAKKEVVLVAVIDRRKYQVAEHMRLQCKKNRLASKRIISVYETAKEHDIKLILSTALFDARSIYYMEDLAKYVSSVPDLKERLAARNKLVHYVWV